MRLLLLFAVFVSNGMIAQNLVYNPSFEEHSNCPDGPGKLWYATGCSSPPQNHGYYLNSCSISPNYSVPTQGSYNYQEARSGNSFVGVFMYQSNDYRENLQMQLITQLINNNYYYVEFWTNRASGPYGGKYAINNIGLAFRNSFTDTTLDSWNNTILPFTPSILKYTNPIIIDTLNWVKINGIYKANGSENYIVIGNFFNNTNTDTLNMRDETYSGSFYFFDDVSVEEITVPFWSYNDTLVNYGDSVLIGPALTGLDIDWYTDNMEFISNGPGIYVSPATSRNYIAKETFNGVETEHNVYVTVIGGVGLAENTLQKIEVYPNPSKGDFSISGIKSESPLQLEVRDVHGKLVFENQNLSKEVNSFHLNVEDGIYFVNVTDLETKEILVKKLVVNK
jgi:hypothetical protein